MANYPYLNPFFQNMFPAIPQTNTTGRLWVKGEKEAEAYPVAPNNAVDLWDSDNSTVYFKQTDASGRATMKIYDLIEREAEGREVEEYATRADMAALLKSLDGVKADLEKLKKRKKGEEDE